MIANYAPCSDRQSGRGCIGIEAGDGREVLEFLCFNVVHGDIGLWSDGSFEVANDRPYM